MSQAPPLTTDERNALKGPSTLIRYLSPVPDNVIATARVNMISFSYPLVALTVDNTSAGWADVREGMTVYVGTTPGGSERGIYRVRQAGNSTTLYLQEMGAQDAGLLAVDIRSSSFANDDYITVVERYDLWSVLPRIVGTTGTVTIYEDYDDTVGTRNTTPENRVMVYVNNRPNHLFTLIQTDTLNVEIYIRPERWPTSSGSSLTHSWVYPDAFTSVSGDTGNILTATVPPGNYTVRYTQHDSIGGDTERIIIINIHHPTLNPPVLISNMPKSDTRDRTGRRMSFDLYDARLALIPSGGMIGYFEVCRWNGVDVPTASTQFVGWVVREEHLAENGLREASLDIVGPSVLMGMIGSTSQVIQTSASPTTWQQAVPALMSAAFMAWYMLRRRMANVLRLFNFTVYSSDPVGQRLPEWVIDKGTVLQQMQALASDRGNFGANSAGELFFMRQPNLVAYADRDSTVVQRDSLDASLYSSISMQVQKYRQVRQIRGEAFSWDGAAALPTPYFSDAPKVMGQGSSDAKLPSQVVTDQAELNQLTGDREAQSNNPYPQIDVTIKRNRDVYEPAEMAMVTVTIPAYLSPTGGEWTKRGIPISVSKRHNADGTADITLTLEGETHNMAGNYVPVPDGNESPYTPPYVPPPSLPLPLPTGGIIIPTSIPPTLPTSTAPTVVPGKAAIRNTPAAGYCTFDISPSAPMWLDRNLPSEMTVISMLIHDEGKSFSRGAYALGNDGTQSYVAYTADVYESAPVWELRDAIDGLFTVIESVRGIPGAIYIFGNDTVDDFTEHLDLTSSSYGGVIPSPEGTAIYGFGSFDGTGLHSSTIPNGSDNYFAAATFPLSFSHITAIRVHATSSTELSEIAVSFDGGLTSHNNFGLNRPSLYGTDGTGYYMEWNSADVYGLAPDGEDAISISIYSSLAHAQYSIDWIEITYSPPNGIARSRYSTDRGMTFGPERVVDTVTGLSGFDAGPRGIAALAGGDERVRTALAGGTYANTVNGGASGSYPIMINVPDYKIGSTSLPNKPDDPDFFFATPVEIAGHALFKVTLAGKVGITPVVGSDLGLGVEPMGGDSWKGKRLMYIGVAGGTRYLFVTKDTGAHWTYTAMALAHSVRIRRYSNNGYEAIAAAGTNGLKHTINGGTTWSTKTASGDNQFAQLFG